MVDPFARRPRQHLHHPSTGYVFGVVYAMNQHTLTRLRAFARARRLAFWDAVVIALVRGLSMAPRPTS